MSDIHFRSDDRPIIVPEPGTADNRVQPFQIEGMDVRGRAVRLGTAAHEIITGHDYPPALARLTGEFLALTALLGSILKFDGILTVQASAKNAAPVNFIVADFKSPGHLRGYLEHDPETLAKLGNDAGFRDLVGASGYLAMTIDQGADMERYQGVVDLAGDTLADCARSYFVQSEQTPTAMRLACGKDPVSGHWRAGGIMVQHLARGEEGGPRLLDRNEQENWSHAAILMDSVTERELIDPQLDLHRLLYRLYHEDGVRVFDPVDVDHRCRCSSERIGKLLASFGADELEDMVVDGKVVVTCQFCSTSYSFDAETLLPG